VSLKDFHIFFILAAILIAFGFAFWCFSESEDPASSQLLMGAVSGVVGVLLLVYLTWFKRRNKLGASASHG